MVTRHRSYFVGIPLSQAEFNVAYLYAHGYGLKQVGTRLGISYHATRARLKRVYQKLNLNDLSGLIEYMEREGV